MCATYGSLLKITEGGLRSALKDPQRSVSLPPAEPRREPTALSWEVIPSVEFLLSRPALLPQKSRHMSPLSDKGAKLTPHVGGC